MAAESNYEVNLLVSHLFRHESGKMVSVLTRIFGTDQLDLAEDVVQDTLLKALQQWSYRGIPENPQAWLYRVAKNKAIDILRREKKFSSVSSDITHLLKSEYTLVPVVSNLFLENEIKDDQLRMMFTCCHPSLSEEMQVALTLKTLCGFSIDEIAKAFVTNEETISKRIYRAKEKFRTEKITFEIPEGKELYSRLDSVLSVLYLFFNEGYNSASPDNLIRTDLVEEAIRLTKLLTENKITDNPEVHALLALMYLHSARIPARLDEEGNILLLKYQDRNKWDKSLNQSGLNHLNKSAEGNSITEYHIQAAIASLHNSSEDFQQTDWENIISLYDQLVRMNDSPIILLNRAIAVSQLLGANAGINAIQKIPALDKIEKYYLLHATLGELYLQAGEIDKAVQSLNKALSLTSSNAEKVLIGKKLIEIDRTDQTHSNNYPHSKLKTK